MQILKQPIDLAIWSIATAIALMISGCASPQQLAAFNLSRAIDLVNKKQDAEAVEFSKKAVAQNPADPMAWYCLGESSYHTGRIDEASAAFQQVLDHNPSPDQLEGSCYFAGLIASEKGNNDEAIHLLEKAVAVKDPPDPITLNVLGGAYMKKGQLQPAIAAYERAVELKPDDANIKTNLQQALDADAAAQAELFSKASLSGLLASSDRSVAHARERNRAIIAAKNRQLPAILRENKTGEISDLVVKIEQTILDLNHESEVAKDSAQQATATNGSPRKIEELRGLTISYRERIELLKPILTALKEEIANRNR
jgi:Flp pilus assembly protein TadD